MASIRAAGRDSPVTTVERASISPNGKQDQPSSAKNSETNCRENNALQDSITRDVYSTTIHAPRIAPHSNASSCSDYPRDMTIPAASSLPSYEGLRDQQSLPSPFGALTSNGINQFFIPRFLPSVAQPKVGWSNLQYPHWFAATEPTQRELPFPAALTTPWPPDVAARLAYSSLLRCHGVPLPSPMFPLPPVRSITDVGHVRTDLSTTVPTVVPSSGIPTHQISTVPTTSSYLGEKSQHNIRGVCELDPDNLESWYRQQLLQQQQQEQQINNPDNDPWLASVNPNGYANELIGASGRRKNATRETTSMLKTWLNEHRKNPYPTKSEKIMLAIITKMSLTQVSTWFANARRRLKKENKMTWTTRGAPGASESPQNLGDNGDSDEEAEDGAVEDRSGLGEELKNTDLSKFSSLMDAAGLRRLLQRFTAVDQLLSGRPNFHTTHREDEQARQQVTMPKRGRCEIQQVYGDSPDSFNVYSSSSRDEPACKRQNHDSEGCFTKNSTELSNKETIEVQNRRKIWSLADIVQERSVEDNTRDSSIEKSTTSPANSPVPDRNSSSPPQHHSWNLPQYLASTPKGFPLGAHSDTSPHPVLFGNEQSFRLHSDNLANILKSNLCIPPEGLATFLMYLHQHHYQQQQHRQFELAELLPRLQTSPGAHSDAPSQLSKDGATGQGSWLIHSPHISPVTSSQGTATQAFDGLRRSQRSTF